MSLRIESGYQFRRFFKLGQSARNQGYASALTGKRECYGAANPSPGAAYYCNAAT
jgi:hypothetical protein